MSNETDILSYLNADGLAFATLSGNHAFTFSEQFTWLTSVNLDGSVSLAVDAAGGLDIVGTGSFKALSHDGLFSGHTFTQADIANVSVHISYDVFGAVLTLSNAVCCFEAGTMIETLAGPRAVETLTVDDTLWAFGRTAPVCWVGNRTIDVATIADKSLVLPIRIGAGALSAGLPERDLVVSPDHAIWLDGKLIPARLLVNGVSIVQEMRDQVTYYHVALDRHDLILAEGVQVESYLDLVADGAERSLAIELGSAVEAYASHGFAPLCIDAASVKPVWDTLSARAGATVAANDCVPTDAPFALMVDGTLVQPVQIGCENGVTRFGCDLPLGARLVTIASASASPWSVSPWLDDRRRLGVAVSSIEADGASLSLQAASLVRGWHGLEAAAHAYRWTDGAASLVLPTGTRRLEIGLIGVAATRRIANAA